MDRDSEEYKEKMKAFYRKVALNGMSLLKPEDFHTTPPSKEPTEPTPSKDQSK